jgi:hypothetical protein
VLGLGLALLLGAAHCFEFCFARRTEITAVRSQESP